MAKRRVFRLVAVVLYQFHVLAQSNTPATPQSNTWNSTFTLSEAQLSRAGLNNEAAAAGVNVAIQFERTNWAGSSAAEDVFYRPPAGTAELAPGSLLAVEQYTNTSLYTLPPNTAMSRILFQSETLNGTAVPASAYVLWPWMPRENPAQPGRFAVVGWGHGTSGVFGECAPSHIRNLWYQYSAPYILALQGYVVVAPDYAGLGVTHHANGTKVKHTYAIAAAHANDLFHSVKAAQTAFSELSSRFVLMGHSQGGLASWAAAERQAHRPVAGYLGAVSASPITDFEAQLDLVPRPASLIVIYVSAGLDAIFPRFTSTAFLTPSGTRSLSLLEEVQGCNSAASELFAQPNFLRPGFVNSSWIQAFASLAVVGRRPVAGPLLVLQGGSDSVVPAELTTRAVVNTCSNDTESRLDYVFLHGTDHVASLYAGQRIWLDWIADRFADKQRNGGCRRWNYSSMRPQEVYQANGNYYLEFADQMYQVA